MTKEEQIKEIREACIKANPEIVELKFGCALKWGGGIPYHSIFVRENKARNYVVCDTSTGEMFIVRNNQVNKIIGRPIRLADVLYTLYGSYEINRKIIACLDSGRFIDVDEGRKENPTIDCGISWNLLKDNLEDQSDECIEFIHNLIK